MNVNITCQKFHTDVEDDEHAQNISQKPKKEGKLGTSRWMGGAMDCGSASQVHIQREKQSSNFQSSIIIGEIIFNEFTMGLMYTLLKPSLMGATRAVGYEHLLAS